MRSFVNKCVNMLINALMIAKVVGGLHRDHFNCLNLNNGCLLEYCNFAEFSKFG